MENRINQLLIILNKSISKNYDHQVIEVIKQVINSLLDLKQNNINLDKLEKLKKDIIFLETNYDQFNELSNYFDPVYIKLKKEIHINEINKIREENKKKKESK